MTRRDDLRCETCGQKGQITFWRPGPGLDRDLRQYRCPKGHVWYLKRGGGGRRGRTQEQRRFA